VKAASLVHHLDLFVDHLAGEAIDRHAHPVMLLGFLLQNHSEEF